MRGQTASDPACCAACGCCTRHAGSRAGSVLGCPASFQMPTSCDSHCSLSPGIRSCAVCPVPAEKCGPGAAARAVPAQPAQRPALLNHRQRHGGASTPGRNPPRCAGKWRVQAGYCTCYPLRRGKHLTRAGLHGITALRCTAAWPSADGFDRHLTPSNTAGPTAGKGGSERRGPQAADSAAAHGAGGTSEQPRGRPRCVG